MEALPSQHPTRALPLYLTNLHHNRQPNLSKCTPTNLIRALLTQPQFETTPSDPLLAMVHQSIHTSDDDASDITKVLSAKRSRQIQVCKRYLFQHANHTNNQLVGPWCQWRHCWFQTCESSTKTHRKIKHFQALTTMKLLVLMWSLLQPSSTPLWEKSLVSSMNIAYLGKGSSIHSSGQLEWFKTLVDEKNPSKLVAPNSSLLWMDILSPLLIRDGLAYATSLGRTHRSGHGHISSCLLHIS